MEGEWDLSDRHGYAPDGAAAGLQGLHEAGGGGREEDRLHRQPTGDYICHFNLLSCQNPPFPTAENETAGALELACQHVGNSEFHPRGSSIVPTAFFCLCQNFYKTELNKEEMYIRYIHKLYDLHLKAQNYTGTRAV